MTLVAPRREGYARDATEVTSRIEKMTTFLPANGVPTDRLIQMERLELALHDWMNENRIDATAIQ